MDAADAITRDSDDEELRVDTPKPPKRSWFGARRPEPEVAANAKIVVVKNRDEGSADSHEKGYGTCNGCFMIDDDMGPIEEVMDYYTDSCYFFECLAGFDDGVPKKQASGLPYLWFKQPRKINS